MPNDSRLPNAGQQQCGFYDVKPAFFGQGTLRVTNAKEFVGKNGNTQLPQRYWDGFWISVDGRLPRNITVGGGLDIGRQVDDHCFTVDVPNQPIDITGTRRRHARGTASTPTGAGACQRRDGVDEQHGLPLQRQHPDQGRLQRQLHLPQHARGRR